MKNPRLLAVAIVILGLLAILLYPKVTASIRNIDPDSQLTGVGGLEIIDVGLEHRRDTWIAALEWCESRGFKEALNPEDLDGTPSYGGFQFKPETFEMFRIKYELPEADYRDYDTQRAIVRHMIDDPTVNFKQQFPNCVKKFVGLPPVK